MAFSALTIRNTLRYTLRSFTSGSVRPAAEGLPPASQRRSVGTLQQSNMVVRPSYPLNPSASVPVSPSSCPAYIIIGPVLSMELTTSDGSTVSARPAQNGEAQRCSSWFSRKLSMWFPIPSTVCQHEVMRSAPTL